MAEFITMFALFYLGIFVAAAVLFVSQIILGVAIDRDAKNLGLDYGTLFLVLTILFGGLPAAIYLIVRSGSAAAPDLPDFTASAKSAKASIITYIISLVLMLVCVFGLMFLVFSNIDLLMELESSGYSAHYSYSIEM